MGGFTTILALLTIFTVAYGDDEVLSSELTISDVMTTFSTIDRMLKALQGPDTDAEGGHSMAEDLLMKVKWYLYGYFSKLIDIYKMRRNLLVPRVELGHGAPKGDIINYPENYYARRIKYLLKLKKKREEQKVGK